VHLTGGYAPRFQAFSVAQASSIEMALSCPARQQVTQAVGRGGGWRHIKYQDSELRQLSNRMWKSNHFQKKPGKFSFCNRRVPISTHLMQKRG